MNSGPALASTSVTAAPFLATKLRALDARLAEAVLRVMSTRDPQAVHNLRVALRRSRTVLKLGRDVFGRFHSDEVRRAFRDVQHATGALRDEEVLLELLASLRVPDPADVRAWVESRRRREGRLRGVLRRFLRSGVVDQGRRFLDAMLLFPARPSRDRRLAKLARRSVEDARRAVERRRAAPMDDAAALHRLRIAYKRLRYTVETFAGALPGDLASLGQAASRFQSRLGSLHDVDVAIACVKHARLLSDGGRAELLAALGCARGDRVAAYERELAAYVIAPAPATHAVGTDSLRKTSTR